MADAFVAFDQGLSERIRRGALTKDDCELLGDALKTVVISDPYRFFLSSSPSPSPSPSLSPGTKTLAFSSAARSSEVDASWTSKVVSEFREALQSSSDSSKISNHEGSTSWDRSWHKWSESERQQQQQQQQGQMSLVSPLQVVAPAFVHVNVTESAPFPGARNTMTLTFAVNIPLPSSSAETGLPSVVRLHGLTGFAQPGGDSGAIIPLEGSSAHSFSASAGGAGDAPSTASLDVASGTLSLHPVEHLPASRTVTVSFALANPPAGGAAPREELRLAIAGGVDVAPTRCSNAHASVPPPPSFLYGTVGGSSAVPGESNTISITFSASVSIASGSTIVVSGLSASPTPTNDALEITLSQPGQPP
jgi:hypothetical protein